MNSEITVPSHIFFCGGAWGCSFHIGVYRALQEKYGLENLSKIKFAGNSAGALIALGCANGVTWKELEEIYLESMNNAKTNGVFGKMSIYHDNVINKVLTQQESYKKLNDKLIVGITTFLTKYTLISRWNNNDELRNCLHASMHVPYYCTFIEKYNNKRAIDGGIIEDFYRFNESTLVISLLDKRGDIYPKPLLGIFKDCYSPDLNNYYRLRDNGTKMMNQWDGKFKSKESELDIKNQWKCKLTVTIRTIAAMMMWIARIMEEIPLKRVVCLVAVIILYKKKNLMMKKMKHFGVFN